MEKEKKPIYKKWWLWVIIVILVIGIFGGNGNNDNNTNNTVNADNVEISNEDKVTFLNGTNGKDFFEILCEVAGLAPKEAVEMGDSLLYTSGNENYSIDVETNKSNEICYIEMMTLQSDDYTNFFVSASRLEYEGSDRATAFNWITDNLGKEASTRIGNANFKLFNGTLGKPILEIYTDGNEDFQKEQIDKLLNK